MALMESRLGRRVVLSLGLAIAGTAAVGAAALEYANGKTKPEAAAMTVPKPNTEARRQLIAAAARRSLERLTAMSDDDSSLATDSHDGTDDEVPTYKLSLSKLGLPQSAPDFAQLRGPAKQGWKILKDMGRSTWHLPLGRGGVLNYPSSRIKMPPPEVEKTPPAYPAAGIADFANKRFSEIISKLREGETDLDADERAWVLPFLDEMYRNPNIADQRLRQLGLPCAVFGQTIEWYANAYEGDSTRSAAVLRKLGLDLNEDGEWRWVNFPRQFRCSADELAQNSLDAGIE